MRHKTSWPGTVMNKRILVVEDNSILCEILKKWLLKAGYEVLTAINELSARKKMKENGVELVLSDVRLQEGDGIHLLEWSIQEGLEIPFVIMTEYASISDAVRAIKMGAKDYLPKPVYEEQLLDLLHDLLRLPSATRQNTRILERNSSAAVKMDRLARRVACSELSVMILGPNGCGKESIARTIHRYSHRSDKPFIAVNCGAVPKELMATEFFGHIKGAFTGAEKDSKGYFETARGGTLFLDEIGNMPYEMQVLLLRVLQEREYSPIGSHSLLKADVRIISATNENMETAVCGGRFREDLYYRLAEFKIRHPALSECPEDILPLADFFRMKYSEEIRRKTSGFTKKAERTLQSYPWPGNVRELCNKVKSAVLLADTALLTCENLGFDRGTYFPVSKKATTPQGNEKERIHSALEQSKGNISHAAVLLGVSRPTLYRKIEKYGLR